MAERNFKATISVGAKLASSFNAVFGNADARAKELAGTMRRLNDQQKGITGYSKASAEVDAARANLKREMEALAAYQKWARETDAGEDGRRTVEEYTQRVDKARVALAKKQDRLVALRGELQAAGVDTNNLSAEIERLARESAQAEARMKALGNVRGAVNELGNSVRRLGESARNAGIAMTALGVAAWKTIGGMAEMGDNAAETGSALGMTAQELMAFRYAGERVGVTTEKMDMALNSLNQKLEDARNGSEKAGAAFAELGLDAEMLASLPAAERMEIIAEAFKNYRGSANKSALATEIFGAKAYKMANVLNLGADGLKRLREEGEKTGFILDEKQIALADEFDSSWGKFKATLVGIRNEIATSLLPTVNRFLDFFTEHTLLLKVAVGAFAVTLTGAAGLALAKFGLDLFNTARAIRGVITALGALQAVEAGGTLATIGRAAAGAIPMLGSLGGVATTAAAAFKGLAVSIMAIPGIGWIAAGITALAFVVWKYWEPIKAFFGGVWDGLTEGFRSMRAELEPVVKPFAEILKTAFAPMLWVVEKIGQVFGWLTSQAKLSGDQLNGFAKAGAAVGKILADVLLAPIRAAVAAVGTLVNAFGALRDIVTGNWGNLGNRLDEQKKIAASALGLRPQQPEGVQRTEVAKVGERVETARRTEVGRVADGIKGVTVEAKPAQAAPAKGKPAVVLPDAMPTKPQGAQTTVKNETSIVINTQPGQDAKAIAAEVMRQLEAKKRDQQRGALYDAVPAY